MQTQTGTNPPAEVEFDVDWRALLGNPVFVVFVLTVLGGLARLWALVGVDFPPGTGSLLYSSAQTLLDAETAFPLEVTHNGGQVPFLYPPVGPYLAAFLSRRLGVPLLGVLTAYPAIASTFSIPLFYALSRRLLPTRLLSSTATAIFALMPAVTLWTLSDDALARATGLILLLLSLLTGHSVVVRRNENYLLPAALMLTLTALTAPELAYFGVYTLLLWLVVFGRNRFSPLNTLLLLVMTTAMLSVWLLPLLFVHGLAPLLSALAFTFYPLAELPNSLTAALAESHTAAIPLLTLLGVLGFFVTVAKRRVLLPLWLVLIPLLQPSTAHILTALPLALLASIAAHQLVLPLIVEVSREHYADGMPFMRFSERGWLRKFNARLYRAPVWLAVGGLVSYSLWTIVVSLSALSAQVVPPVQRQVMQEIIALDAFDAQIPPDARFWVLTGNDTWEQDGVAAWFPVLAARQNALLVPGSVWQGNFEPRRRHYASLQACLHADIACLLNLEADIAGLATDAEEIPTAFTHLYIAPGVQGALLGYLRQSEQFNRVSSDQGSLVYERVME